MTHRPAFGLAALVIALLATALPCSAVVYVKWDSPGPVFDGTSWETAFHTVQAAIESAEYAEAPVEVWVAKGTYVESLLVRPYVQLYGGFAGTETSRNQRDFHANETILDGNQNSFVVHFGSGPAERVDGFTIRNGRMSGVQCIINGATIANNRIYGNGYGRGAGIYCDNRGAEEPLVITGNFITGNIASGNYGMEFGDGGGMYLANCLSARVTNNTIVGNHGQGVTISGCTDVVLANNIVAFNTTGIITRSSTPILRNNCVYNSPGCDFPTSYTGEGNISLDPGLLAPEYGKLDIRACSPCVDAGDDSFISTGDVDIDCRSRIRGAHVDIGAQESDGVLRTFSPAIIRVSTTGSDANDGSSWDQAKRTVQAAISSVGLSGAEIWVAAGTYKERIALKTYAHLYGGFAGTESVRDERDWSLNQTILDADGLPGTVVTANKIPSYSSTVDGFTICKGSSNGISCSYASPRLANNTITSNRGRTGGGIYCTSSAPVIADNAITGNSATEHGGGIYCYNSQPTITGNTITGNSASYYGGAMYLDRFASVIENNTISDNTAREGAGIHCAASPRIAGNTIRANRASAEGGAVYCSRSSAIITENVISDNNASKGAGVYCNTSSPQIVDNTIRANIASAEGGAVYGTNNSNPDVIGNTISENSASEGGAVYCSNSSPKLQTNQITGNTSASRGAISLRSNSSPVIFSNTLTGNSGGGIHCDSSSPSITANRIEASPVGVYCLSGSPAIIGNTIKANRDPYGAGGAIWCSTSLAVIANNMIVDNNVGISCSSSSPTITSNTIAYNSVGVHCSSASPVLSNNVTAFNQRGVYVYSGTPVLRNNCVHGSTYGDYTGVQPGVGDISSDPLFVDSANGNYHLSMRSPCIDAGWDDAPGMQTTDIDGEARIIGDAVDIGSDECRVTVGFTVRKAKLATDDMTADLTGAIVAAVFPDCFYVEADDRSCGIRVEKIDHGLHVGDRADIIGDVNIGTNGEKYIEARTVVANSTGSVRPVGLNNRLIGGANWSCDPASTGGQQGVREYRLVNSGGASTRELADALGLNNIGLLVTTFGTVTHIGDTYIYIDDGSHLDDGSGHIGLKVSIEGLPAPELSSRVRVTGVSTCYKSDGSLFRLLRAVEIVQMQG